MGDEQRFLTTKRNFLVDTFLILLLILTPLAYGTVHIPSIIIFSIAAVIIFNIYFLNRLDVLKQITKLPVIKWGIFLVVVVLFQLLPLPKFLLKFISPSTYGLYMNYSLQYADTNSLRSISIYLWPTIFELIKIISYGLIFLVVLCRAKEYDFRRYRTVHSSPLSLNSYLQLGLLTALFSLLLHSFCDFNLHIPANAFYFVVIFSLTQPLFHRREAVQVNHRFILKIVNCIIIIGFLISIFAIIQKFSFNNKIYWIGKESGSAFGPYINYDHYAGYMSLCVPLAIASFIGSVATSSFSRIEGIRKKILWFSTFEANKTLLYLFFSVVMTTSLFLSASRAGIMSFTISILSFFIAIIIKTKRNIRSRLLSSFILVILLITTMIIWVGPEPFLGRFRVLANIEGPILNGLRPRIWKETFGLIRDFPMFGTGLGTFSHIFPAYRTFGGEKFLRYAHSDYLQFISEMGILGAVFIIAFFVFYAKLFIRALKKLK
ncbi:MAG: O-antigen ligase family protein [Candidatus Omnitrophica bacterium]|nr:O-antigen ligase family protein [Candidatus Omnitrophota bacterium]